MCKLTSTSTEWKASKWTGQYECNPRRAFGGIRNSWTAAGTSREACKVELQMVHYNKSNYINIVTGFQLIQVFMKWVKQQQQHP